MKKLFFLAILACSVSVMAQHVSPVSIQVAELHLDSLRQLYGAEPTMYRAALNVLDQQLDKNAAELKAAKAELKDEQALAKQIESSLNDATKMAASLKKLYAQEEKEVKGMQKVVENQQKGLNKLMGIKQESREAYLLFLEQEQKELNYSLREVADRLRAITDLETSIQNSRTALQAYVQETQQKNLDLMNVEGQIKERAAVVKEEQKSAKKMQ